MSTGIGARVPRKEDARHLAGEAQFVGDLSFPRLWEVAFVRSPLAHARIRSVTVPERFSGRVLTAEDMDGVHPIRAESSLPTYKPSDYPPLARGKVRFAGECVALCIAPTRAEAEDIAEAVELDLEALPAVTDSLAARRPDAPLVHEDWGDNLFLTTSADGDIESVRTRAAVVIEREYRTARQCMVPMEGKAVLARHDARKGQLVVYTSTQVPHLIRTGLSQCLGMDQADVRVVAPDVGGGFGYKCVLQPEEISVSWAAMRTGRPLRWVEDRREHLCGAAWATLQPGRSRWCCPSGARAATSRTSVCARAVVNSFCHGCAYVRCCRGSPSAPHWISPACRRASCARSKRTGVRGWPDRSAVPWPLLWRASKAPAPRWRSCPCPRRDVRFAGEDTRPAPCWRAGAVWSRCGR